MKVDSGLLILARRNPITEEEWQMLVNARSQMLKEHLRSMSLGAVGDLKMINDYFHTHDLKRDNPVVEGDEGLGLETKGIFPSDDNWAAVSGNTEHHRGGFGHAVATTEKLWGLTRNGEWITIEVYITRSQEPYKYEHRYEEVARAKKVILKKSSLAEVCVFSKRTPEYIWKRLGQIAKDWAEHRQQLYEDAALLREQVLREEAVLEVISQ